MQIYQERAKMTSNKLPSKLIIMGTYIYSFRKSFGEVLT